MLADNFGRIDAGENNAQDLGIGCSEFYRKASGTDPLVITYGLPGTALLKKINTRFYRTTNQPGGIVLKIGLNFRSVGEHYFCRPYGLLKEPDEFSAGLFVAVVVILIFQGVKCVTGIFKVAKHKIAVFICPGGGNGKAACE